jgi:ABC-type uncharacterized transport system substrate-binding protein
MNYYKTDPVTNNGKKWRIGYYEGGPYTDYQSNLKSVINGLMELGWMKKREFPEFTNLEDTKLLWEWLCEFDSPYITFMQDAYWSASWDKDMRKHNKTECIKKLKSGHIDFMLSLGTWAGQDLANNEHSVPTFCLSISDPIKAKIIKSANDSGYDHVIAKCDPTRYKRQLELFHDIIQFKKLGVVYEDTFEGRSYASLDDIQDVARKKGFKVIESTAPGTGISSLDKIVHGYFEACMDIVYDIDAFYLTDHRGVNTMYFEKILAPFFEYNIPTWSRKGSNHVKYGVFMSIAKKNFDDFSFFYATTIAKIFHGAKPGDLKQVFKEPLSLSINLKTAELIGYKVPKNVIKAADTIYYDIDK